MLFQIDARAAAGTALPVAGEVPKFQPLQRDIAVWVAETVTYAAILAAIDNRSRAG